MTVYSVQVQPSTLVSGPTKVRTRSVIHLQLVFSNPVGLGPIHLEWGSGLFGFAYSAWKLTCILSAWCCKRRQTPIYQQYRQYRHWPHAALLEKHLTAEFYVLWKAALRKEWRKKRIQSMNESTAKCSLSEKHVHLSIEIFQFIYLLFRNVSCFRTVSSELQLMLL